MLLPFTCLGTVIGSEMFDHYPLVVLLFRRNIMFEHDGKKTAFANMAWFIGNVQGKTEDGFIKVRYIDDLEPDNFEDESFSIIGQDVD